jgi:hypothetical protein
MSTFFKGSNIRAPIFVLFKIISKTTSGVVRYHAKKIYQLVTPIDLFPLNSQQKWSKAHNCVDDFLEIVVFFHFSNIIKEKPFIGRLYSNVSF